MRMNYYKLFLLFFTFISSINLSVYAVEVYNAGNDFTVQLDSLQNHIYNNNLSSSFKFRIINNQDYPQDFKLNISQIKGWDIITPQSIFSLDAHKSKEIEIKFKANQNFKYSTSVLSSDTIKISQNSEYKGYFKFPVSIIGSNQNISLNYELNIDKLAEVPVNYNIALSTEDLSPIKPLKYTITAKNLKGDNKVEILVYFNSNLLFKDEKIFSNQNYFQIFVHDIPLDLVPNIYNVDIVLRSPQNSENTIKEWRVSSKLKVDKFENLNVKYNKVESYFKDIYTINLKNNGNTESNFQKEVSSNFFKNLFFTSNSNFSKSKNGFIISEDIPKGQEKSITYSYNYSILYILFLVIFLGFIRYFLKKNSNPLLIDTKFYEIKKTKYEGVKSFKVRLGFENVKINEIENIKLIFRMPSYLNVKDKSFLLSEPNHVLKGSSQYKLIWEFKRFEKADSRIIGFILENNKGILGDIKLPDLEFELKINGKIKKFTSTLPSIKG